MAIEGILEVIVFAALMLSSFVLVFEFENLFKKYFKRPIKTSGARAMRRKINLKFPTVHIPYSIRLK